MITTRTIREAIELGDRPFTIEATVGYDEDGNEVAASIVINHETYYTGDVLTMLRYLTDTLVAIQNALCVTSDDEVAA